MGIQFIVGPPGSGKTHWCLRAARELAKEDPLGPPILMLVLQQASYQTESDLLQDGVRGTSRVRVVSYGRLEHWIRSETPSSALPALNEAHRRVLVTTALARLRDRHENGGLAGIANVDRSIAAILKETKSARLHPEDLERAATHLASTRPGLARKLADIARVLREYNGLVEDHFEDPDDSRVALAETIRHFEALQGAQVFVDSYSAIAPTELEILGALAERCTRVTIAMDMDRDRYERLMAGPGTVDQRVPDRFSRFFRTEEMLCHIRGMAADRGIGILEPVFLPEGKRSATPPRFAHSPGIAHLASNFLRRKVRMEAEPQEIRMEVAITPRDEAKRAVEHLLDWKRTLGWQWKDMAVITRQLSGYALALSEELRNAGIPHFIDRREPMEAHPLVQGTIAALEVALRGFRTRPILAFARSGLYEFDADGVARLQQYTSAYPPAPDRWLQKGDWLAAPDRNAFDDASPREGRPGSNPHDGLRREIVAQLKTLADEVASARGDGDLHEVAGVARALCAFVHRAGTMDTDRDRGVLAQWAARIGEMVEAAGTERLEADALMEVFHELLTSLTLPQIPPAADQVVIGQADRSRFPAIRGAVVVGLAEGSFPAAASNATLLTDSERDTLESEAAEMGWRHSLEPSTRKAFQSEAYFALQAFTRASDRLVLLRPSADSKGKALEASPYWNELVALHPEGTEVAHVLGSSLRPDRVRLPGEAAAVLVRDCLGGPGRREEFRADTLLPKVDLGLPGGQRERFEDVLRHAGRRNAARLDPALARELLGTELKASASSLRDFASCPFKHFMRKMIRAEVPDKVTITLADLGNLAHATMKAIGEDLASREESFADLQEDGIDGVVDRAFADPLRRLCDSGLFARPHEREAAMMLRDSLRRLVRHLAALSGVVGNRPVALEKNFAPQKQDLVVPSITVELEGGHSFQVSLRGQIDRVDQVTHEGRVWLMVFDYKSSDKKMQWSEAAEDLDLQLPVYLWVLSHNAAKLAGTEDARIAGAFYQRIHPGKHKKVPAGVYTIRGVVSESALDAMDRDELGNRKLMTLGTGRSSANEATRKSGDVLGDHQFNQIPARVEQAIKTHAHRIASGLVEVRPVGGAAASPCEYCDFKLACRVDYGMNSPREIPRLGRPIAVERWLGPPIAEQAKA